MLFQGRARFFPDIFRAEVPTENVNDVYATIEPFIEPDRNVPARTVRRTTRTPTSLKQYHPWGYIELHEVRKIVRGITKHSKAPIIKRKFEFEKSQNDKFVPRNFIYGLFLLIYE